MVTASLLRRSWMSPVLPMPASGPPWELSAHVPAVAVVSAIWLAAALGGAGVAAGLLAVRRGAPVPLQALLATAAIAVVALVLLPPSGSTDALDYAVYGHIAVVGHSPYVMTPAQFRREYLLPGVPRNWQGRTSVYGPLATGEQFLAAWLGGGSLAADVFWLKLANAGAFAAVAFAAHRLLPDRASKLRAHLLWTANPLMLWSVLAAGHMDVLAAAAGLAGLLICDQRSTLRPTARALAAGTCIGLAVDFKASYALFGLALAWSMRRRPRQLLAALGGAAAVLLVSFALAGPAAWTAALDARSDRGMYALLISHVHVLGAHVLPLAAGIGAGIAVLAMWRLPPGYRGATAVPAALAISLGWLLAWPEQDAWYAVMALCLLVCYPASRLDWPVLGWLTMSAITDMPGRPLAGRTHPLGTVLPVIHRLCYLVLQPSVVACVLVVLVALCVTRRWNVSQLASPAAVIGAANAAGVTGSITTAGDQASAGTIGATTG